MNHPPAAWLAIHRLPYWHVRGVLATVTFWTFGAALTRTFRREFPPRQRTVGDLARFLVGAAPRLFEPAGRRWSRAEVAATIRAITIEELGLKRGDYREEAEFVRDFGAG